MRLRTQVTCKWRLSVRRLWKALLTALVVASFCVLRVYELPGGDAYIARVVSPAAGKSPCKHPPLSNV
jgi:hypothetical protein